MTSQQIISVGLPLAIMAFVVYRRARAHIGRQKMKPTRMTVRMGILTLVGVGFLVAMPLHSAVYAVIGAALGLGLALVSLRLAHMEHTAEGTFYTANLYIGLGVTALLVARVLSRVIGAADTMQAAAAPAGQASGPMGNPWAGMFASPLTLVALFLMIGYYVVFYAGLLRRAKKLAAPSPLLPLPTNPSAESSGS